MIAAMAALASSGLDTPFDESNALTWVDGFFKQESSNDPGALSAPELAKVRELRRDLVDVQARIARAERDRLSWLGALYARFESAFGRPGARERGYAEVPPAAPSDAPACEYPECALLDRLSVSYGGRYRGAIVMNYALALVAGLIAVAAAHQPGAVEFWVGVVESLLFVAILALFLVGRTPDPAASFWDLFDGLAQRWHQRWLEYRTLSERFRYVSLLRPLDGSAADAWEALINEGARPPAWQDRYFLWRLRASPPPQLERDAWYARVVDTMEHQTRYHERSAARRHNVVHRLHVFAMRMFGLALLLLFVRVVVLGLGLLPAHHGLHAASSGIALFAALMTICAAAAHGVLATTELAWIAGTSHEMAQRIDGLRRSVEATWRDNPDPTAVRGEVVAFCRLVTEEARGWKGLLRYKDVPLTH
jgi:hypothetical protein